MLARARRYDVALERTIRAPATVVRRGGVVFYSLTTRGSVALLPSHECDLVKVGPQY